MNRLSAVNHDFFAPETTPVPVDRLSSWVDFLGFVDSVCIFS